jgi:hypothetical protein
MAGSSEMISPLSLYLFQQPHETHLKFFRLVVRGTIDWQKKHWNALFLLNSVDIQPMLCRGRVVFPGPGWPSQATMIQTAPSSLAGRGDVVLQPFYFRSSIYVKAFRDDLSTLIFRYHEAYCQRGSVEPFALFKAVWTTMGWHWLHFKVFDSRSRQAFLEVTIRLFLGEVACILNQV